MERTQFTFYRSFLDGISRIRNKTARCDAYDAIIRYALDGTEPNVDAMPDAAALAFIMARPNLDSGRRKAEGGSARPTSNKEDIDKMPSSNAEDKDKIPTRPTQQDIDIDIGIDIEQKLSTEDIQRVIDAWNAQGLTKVSKIPHNSKRFKNLTARVDEFGLDGVLKAINSISASKFLRGDNDRGWICTLDWILLPSNMPKVMEGNYKDRPKKGYDPKNYGDHSKPIMVGGKTVFESLMDDLTPEEKAEFLKGEDAAI